MESGCEFDVSLIVDGKPQKVPASIREEVQDLDYLSVGVLLRLGNK